MKLRVCVVRFSDDRLDFFFLFIFFVICRCRHFNVYSFFFSFPFVAKIGNWKLKRKKRSSYSLLLFRMRVTILFLCTRAIYSVFPMISKIMKIINDDDLIWCRWMWCDGNDGGGGGSDGGGDFNLSHFQSYHFLLFSRSFCCCCSPALKSVSQYNAAQWMEKSQKKWDLKKEEQESKMWQRIKAKEIDNGFFKWHIHKQWSLRTNKTEWMGQSVWKRESERNIASLWAHAHHKINNRFYRRAHSKWNGWNHWMNSKQSHTTHSKIHLTNTCTEQDQE